MPKKFKIILLVLALLSSGGLLYKYNFHKSEAYVRLFHEKECFRFFDSKHEGPDGYITFIGTQEYTVMWAPRVARRTLVMKMGYKVPIKWLDMYAHVTKCPH